MRGVFAIVRGLAAPGEELNMADFETHPIGTGARLAALEAEVADLKASVIAFAGPAAAEWAHDRGLPSGHLHPLHFDLLQRCGARMDSFTRHEDAAKAA
jgi:hypothetical protein